MQQHDFANVSAPPDLLRRFVPTPFKAICRIGEVPVVVQTNDTTLLPTFSLEGNFVKPGEELFEWKLVRDADVREQLDQPVILNCGALEVVQMGPACLLAQDRERRELLGFVGACVDGNTYQEYLVPFMQTMTERAFAAWLSADVACGATGAIHE
jgi:hypothetical protein